MVSRNAFLSAALIAAAASSPAFSQSWNSGFRVEGPVYFAPGVYQRALPLSPDAVFNALEAAGYREFSPMAPREPVYRLNAVNPRGDLVALEISMFTGQIERERILAVHQRPPLRAYRPAPVPQAAPVAPAAPPPANDGGHDPLVVY